jgi:hypothetical protein
VGKVNHLIPDWLVPLVPYWPLALIVAGAGLAWRIAGAPGLATFAAAVGFVLGRRSVKTDAPIQPKKKKRFF